MIRTAIQAILFEWQHMGWQTAVKSCVETVAQWRKVYILRRSLKEPLPTLKLPAGINLRQATLADQALWQTMVPAYRVKRFSRKIEAGEVCFMALAGEQLVGIAWAAFADSPSAQQIPIRLEAREAYLWGAYVCPSQRGHGLAAALSLALSVWLKEHGYTQTMQLTEQANAPSVKTALRMGNELDGQYTIFKFLKWKWIKFQHPTALLPA